ncbi:MAG: Ig-like domain-containing protein [Candidatus Zixiibacteriota bacterium]
MFADDSLYHLQAGSPLINAGDPALLDVDSSRSDVGWTGGPGGISYEYLDLPPLLPESLTATGRDTVLTVRWLSRPEADLAAYRLYRGFHAGFWAPGLPPTSVIAPSVSDTLMHLSRTQDSLYIVVTAFDTSGHESEPSSEAEYIISEHPLGHAPQWRPVAAAQVKARDSLTLIVQASDPDGDSLALTAIDLPANASFIDHGDGTGEFGWRPPEAQIGEHDVRLVVSDGFLTDTLDFAITVRPANRAPVWSAIEPQVVQECETLKVRVVATDADGDSLELRANPLPPHAVFTDSGNGVGSLVFTPDASQAGGYRFDAFAWDGETVATLVVSVTVLDGTCATSSRSGILRVYPNPLNSTGTVEVSIPGDAGSSQAIKLVLHDLVGRTVATYDQGSLSGGVHILGIDVGESTLGRNLASGVYFLRLQAGSQTVGDIVKVAVMR